MQGIWKRRKVLETSNRDAAASGRKQLETAGIVFWAETRRRGVQPGNEGGFAINSGMPGATFNSVANPRLPGASLRLLMSRWRGGGQDDPEHFIYVGRQDYKRAKQLLKSLRRPLDGGKT